MSAGLKKKVNGEFVDIGDEGNPFRGAWSADALALQFTFADGIPEDFTKEFHPTAGLEPVAIGVSELGIGGTPGPFTGAVKLPVAELSDAAYSQLNLDLSTLGIKNISRVSCWFGTGVSSSDDYYHEEILVNNVVKAATAKGPHSWVELSVSATESDVVSFRYEGDYANMIAWASHGGMTGVKIYNRAEPYMLGDFVTHEGQMWESLIDNNGDTPGATGTWVKTIALPPISGTTVQRPSPALVGKGYLYYDETLEQPIWSNGTTWKDASGVAV